MRNTRYAPMLAALLDAKASMYVPGSQFAAPDPLSAPLGNKAVASGHHYTRVDLKRTISLARGG